MKVHECTWISLEKAHLMSQNLQNFIALSYKFPVSHKASGDKPGWNLYLRCLHCLPHPCIPHHLLPQPTRMAWQRLKIKKDQLAHKHTQYNWHMSEDKGQLGPFPGLSVTENTWQAMRAVTWSTVCVKSPIDRIAVTFISCAQRRRLTGDSRIMELNVEKALQLPGDWSVT